MYAWLARNLHIDGCNEEFVTGGEFVDVEAGQLVGPSPSLPSLVQELVTFLGKELISEAVVGRPPLDFLEEFRSTRLALEQLFIIFGELGRRIRQLAGGVVGLPELVEFGKGPFALIKLSEGERVCGASISDILGMDLVPVAKGNHKHFSLPLTFS